MCPRSSCNNEDMISTDQTYHLYFVDRPNLESDKPHTPRHEGIPHPLTAKRLPPTRGRVTFSVGNVNYLVGSVNYRKFLTRGPRALQTPLCLRRSHPWRWAGVVKASPP